jgi:hypothetical protein
MNSYNPPDFARRPVGVTWQRPHSTAEKDIARAADEGWFRFHIRWQPRLVYRCTLALYRPVPVVSGAVSSTLEPACTRGILTNTPSDNSGEFERTCAGHSPATRTDTIWDQG